MTTPQIGASRYSAATLHFGAFGTSRQTHFEVGAPAGNHKINQAITSFRQVLFSWTAKTESSRAFGRGGRLQLPPDFFELDRSNMQRSLVAKIKRVIPEPVIGKVKKWRTMYNVVREFGGRHPRECPICDYKGLFFAYGVPLQFDSCCPRCRSIGRHRQHHLLVQVNPQWIDDKVVLHFAPEPCFVKEYEKRARRYLRADYDPAPGEVQVDAQNMVFPDGSIDTIICHNVIEHVPSDRRALAEMFRVLKPGGVALITAPVIEAWANTYENPRISTFRDRDLHFNQWDHFRLYGQDFRDRLREPGFELSLDVATEPDVSRYGLDRGETIFVARRPSEAAG